MLGQCHGQAVHLFTAGACSAPDAQWLATGRQGVQMPYQPFKVLGFSKEIGFVGREQVDADLALHLSFTAVDQRKIFAVAVQMVVLQTLAQTTADQGLLARMHADAGALVDKALEIQEFCVADMKGHFCKKESV